MKEGNGAPSLRESAKKRAKPARGEAWGILNPWGDVWTHDTFATPEAAKRHLVAFWSQPWFPPTDTDKFRIVRVLVTVSAMPSSRKDGASQKPSNPAVEGT